MQGAVTCQRRISPSIGPAPRGSRRGSSRSSRGWARPDTRKPCHGSGGRVDPPLVNGVSTVDCSDLLQEAGLTGHRATVSQSGEGGCAQSDRGGAG